MFFVIKKKKRPFIALGTLVMIIAVIGLAGLIPAGLLKGQTEQLPTNVFSTDMTADGVVIETNAHNILRCTDGGSASVLDGELLRDTSARYYVYEYTGNEPPTDGRFFLSAGEFVAVSPDTRQAYQKLLTQNGQITQFIHGRTYYVMSNTDLFFQCDTGLGLPLQCGDGVVQSNEQCDDGNTMSQDGCSASCTTENGFACNGNPSTCAAICGDGTMKDKEECDDGNTDENDGCANTCVVEDGWACSGEPSFCTIFVPNLSAPTAAGEPTDLVSDNVEKPAAPVEEESIVEEEREEEDLETAGSLLIAHNPAVEQIMDAASQAQLMMNLEAVYEDIAITQMRVNAVGNTNAIDYIEYTVEGEEEPFATADRENCSNEERLEEIDGIAVTSFCAVMQRRELVVPQGEAVSVTARVHLNTTKEAGSSLQLFILNASESIRALGELSQKELTFSQTQQIGAITFQKDEQGDGHIVGPEALLAE